MLRKYSLAESGSPQSPEKLQVPPEVTQHLGQIWGSQWPEGTSSSLSSAKPQSGQTVHTWNRPGVEAGLLNPGGTHRGVGARHTSPQVPCWGLIHLPLLPRSPPWPGYKEGPGPAAQLCRASSLGRPEQEMSQLTQQRRPSPGPYSVPNLST